MAALNFLVPYLLTEVARASPAAIGVALFAQSVATAAVLAVLALTAGALLVGATARA
ncbi:MAG TPA: hypothetical protein VJT49_22690 [Amycolatopsis sp.]|uniref:hypothetical protein n=1 Tax=Amycolatopsis sp. TaxID=37632 RepID=UPI002B46066C|nr:hypothetical protein [Amycolatopsis sp.]HKS47868.1 hypothetical protein [Amycolatopsis sp.]